MPSEVAPGVHRVGNAYVNCYLIEDGNQLTLVDAGLPGFRAQLDEYLRSRGRSIKDIAAVILTHGHGDHVGMADGVRLDAPAPVYVHAADFVVVRNDHISQEIKPHRRRRQGFSEFRFGYAAAISWVLVGLILVLSLAQLFYFRRRAVEL